MKKSDDPPVHKKLIANRLVRFVLVGILNTIVGYTIFAVGVTLHVPSGWALAIATVLGIVFNFFTTGGLVFKSRTGRALPAFIAAYAITYLFNLGLLRWLERMGVGPLTAQAICLPPTVLLSFLLMSQVVFRRTEPASTR